MSCRVEGNALALNFSRSTRVHEALGKDFQIAISPIMTPIATNIVISKSIEDVLLRDPQGSFLAQFSQSQYQNSPISMTVKSSIGSGSVSRSHSQTTFSATYYITYKWRDLDQIKRLKITYPAIISLTDSAKVTVFDKIGEKNVPIRVEYY